MLDIVGGSFTALTVTTKFVLALYCPSLTLTVIVVTPFWLAAGLTVTVRFDPLPPKTMLLVGTSVGLDDPLLNVRLPIGVSASPTVNGIAPVAVSTVVNWSAISLIVGAAPVADTVVTVKLHPPPSEPWSPLPSSMTYNDQIPLAACPVNADNAVPYGPAGAGTGKLSPGTKSVGL